MGLVSIQRVLIGFDFSEASHRAAVSGVALAEQLGAEAIVLSVLESGDLRVAMSLPLENFEVEQVHERVAEWVDQQYEKLQKSVSGPFRRLIRRGIPSTEIVAAAKDENAGLIVLGAVGISRRISIGSVAGDVVRHSAIPVMLVPKSGS
jgi:nucleotide-binding universal stress UspA family protein